MLCGRGNLEDEAKCKGKTEAWPENTGGYTTVQLGYRAQVEPRTRCWKTKEKISGDFLSTK